MLRSLFLIVMLGTLGLWLGYNSFKALKSGVANAAGKEYRRTARPFLFWLTTVVQAVWSVICFYVLWVSLSN